MPITQAEDLAMQNQDPLRTPSRQADFVIAGGGPAGLALACTLADAMGPDVRIAVLDQADFDSIAARRVEDDPRAYALSASSKTLLETIGAWERLAPHAQPVAAIEITDSSLNDAFRPRLLSYDNQLQDGAPGTYVVSDVRLHVALVEAARRRRGVELAGGARIAQLHRDVGAATVELASGSAWQAPLVVAADGRGSFVRDSAGIKCVRWEYRQIGIVTRVKLAKPHGGRAVQHFLPAGPFAILPLPGDEACITWSEDATRGAEIVRRDDAGFKDELERRFGTRLGDFELVAGRAWWPLNLQLARTYVSDRVALIGDAAHGVHPIAGQGLNLGLKDVAALTEVIADAARLGLDYGALDVLERYQRWRRTDATMSAMVYDSLNRLFSNDSTVLRTVRDAGLGLVERLPALKRFFVAEAAGLTGDVPKLLRGLPV